MPKGIPKKEEWKPTPQTTALPPKPRPSCECGDVESIHYGTEKKQCNQSGCECREFRPK